METKDKAGLDEAAVDEKRPRKMRASFLDAVAGIVYCLRTQRNVPLIIAATVIILILSRVFSISKVELLFVVTAIFLVVLMEVVNTAIEKAVDVATEEFHPLARIAKDVSAGAVLVAVIYSIVIGLVIFLPKLIRLLFY